MEISDYNVFGVDSGSLPFSAAVISGNFLFSAGHVPLRDGKLHGTSFEEQANHVLDLIEETLAQSDLTIVDVVKVNVWITAPVYFDQLNRIFRARFGTHRPARTTLVSQLVLEGAFIEIEVVAERNQRILAGPSDESR